MFQKSVPAISYLTHQGYSSGGFCPGGYVPIPTETASVKTLIGRTSGV